LASRNPDHDPYILCVARLDDPRKHIELLLEAYALLPNDLRNATTLKLAGSSGPPEHFWQRATQLGLGDRIEYVARPSQQELVSLYQKAAVFALPSDEEGLGVVLLEAMACGIPVVSTRSGGPDGIITEGRDGFLTPLNDAITMAERLADVLRDSELNVRMGLNARNTIEARYARGVTGAEFISVWDSLLGRMSGARQ
jgi:glycosyltransferase involved in cell wall biosynthesis